MIKVDNVSMRFRLANDHILSLKEFVVKKLAGKLEYNEFVALNNVSFSIEKGEVVGIVGSNGAGKSTLLKIISGILHPTSGDIRVEGSIAPMLELGAGFDMDLTAKENVYLNGAVLGYSKKYLDDRYNEIVRFSELEQFMDTPIRNFSSGMIMRLAFSIATLVNPDILIVDEILSVGDAHFQKKSSKRMRELMSGGTTVILVSHSLDQIRSMCTKVVWLDHGVVQMVGNTNEVCSAYMKFSRQESLLDEQSQLENENKAEVNLLWREKLYTPTFIDKIGDEFFIVDCWHHRVIYNDNLLTPIGEWKSIYEHLGDPHTITSDGNVYLIEDTLADEVRVFKRDEDIFTQTQVIERIGNRPHKIVYDEENQLFYGISAMSQQIFILKNNNGEVTTEKVIRLGYLMEHSYIRSIRIIDRELYFVSGPGKIIVADYANSSFNQIREYEVPYELCGMNDMVKIGAFYYISVYQNGNGQIAPKLVRVQDLNDLSTSNYEDIYDVLGLQGVPYNFTVIQDRVFLTEIDSYSRIISFKVTDDQISDITVHYDYGPPDDSSIQRRSGS